MTVDGTTGPEGLASLWPLFGLVIKTPRLELRLPREHELPALAVAARDIAGPDGFAKRRSVGTGSWITRTRQGNGYGTEARAAVLDLAFGHLGAAEALTEYIEGNHASERVSRKLGYVPNGQRAAHREDTGRATEYLLRLDRTAWEGRALPGRTAVTGLGPCLPLLGLPGSGDPA